MGYGRALLTRDYTAEKLKLEDEQEALAKKAGKKSLWGSVGGALGGLLAMGLTGGTAAPLVAAAMAGGGTALGGLLGQKLSGTGKIDSKSISGGKFLSSSRKDVKESFKDVDKELFQGAIVGGLTSGLTAGMGQHTKLALDARKAKEAGSSALEIANIKKGVGFGESLKTSWLGKPVTNLWDKYSGIVEERDLMNQIKEARNISLTSIAPKESWQEKLGLYTGMGPEGYRSTSWTGDTDLQRSLSGQYKTYSDTQIGGIPEWRLK